MIKVFLRYALVGIAAVGLGVASGDPMYMFSRQNGGFYFGSAPAAPRFAAYSAADRFDRRRQSDIEPSDLDKPPIEDKERYDVLVTEVARGYQLDSALLHAVISVESHYNPQALSPAGALGLMQLMPATARRYGVENALDPEQNLRAGAQYLRDLLSMFGSDLRLALAAYHAGETAVARHQNSIPPFQTTIDYVSRVLDKYYKYRHGASR